MAPAARDADDGCDTLPERFDDPGNPSAESRRTATSRRNARGGSLTERETRSRTESDEPRSSKCAGDREQVDPALRRFIEELASPVWLTDAHLAVVWMNPAAAKFLERPSDECLGRRLNEWIPSLAATSPADVVRQWSSACHGGHEHSCELVLRNDDGRELEASVVVHLQRDERGVGSLVCCAQDLSERRRYELQLQEAQERLRAVVDAMFDPMVSIDAFGTIHQVNPAVERVFGYRAEDLVGRNVNVLIPEPHHSAHDEYLANYRATGRTSILGRTRDFEVVRKDGSRILCSLAVSRAELPGGRGPVFSGTFRDVTERRRAERQLRESELRFHALFDNSFEYFGLLTPDGLVLEANQTALEASGSKREDVVGKPFWDTRWWRHSPDLQVQLRDAIARAARGEFVRFEATHPQKDGSYAEIDFTIKPMRDDAGVIVMLIPEGRNITEIKRAQRAEMAMLRALATVGESAALLAHEIKNPITAVNVALRAVADQLGEDHKEVLEDLVARMQRLEHMMRRTLSFARPLDLKRAAVDVSAFLGACATHLKPQIARSAGTLEIRAAPRLPRIDVDAPLLEEVVANLVTNALEAKNGPAQIVVSAELLAPAAVVLRVDDDGPGVPESMRTRLFKPFVTTKQKGNGFGLAICKKIIEEHGGTIAIATSPLGGARFEITLPVAPPPRTSTS